MDDCASETSNYLFNQHNFFFSFCILLWNDSFVFELSFN